MVHVLRNIKIIAGAAVIGLVAAGGAWAYYASSGTVAGSATGGTATAMVLTQDSPPVIFPGETKILSGTIQNPNAGDMQIKGIHAVVGNMPGTGCDPAWFVATDSTTAMTVFSTPAAAQAWSGVSLKFTNEAAIDQSACQGVTIPVTFTVVP